MRYNKMVNMYNTYAVQYSQINTNSTTKWKNVFFHVIQKNYFKQFH